MPIRTADQIRREFLDFFAGKRHTIVPSSPVVPHDDPTLLFANAGMNQFKPIFLGQRAPDVDKWNGVVPGMPTRAADTQKCIRAGGKHNDLDDVGRDTYHHTFFEMLGNWSFGDYFKKEAIEWAWELLTQVWGIDRRRLHATYFQGDEAEGLAPDTEARDLWTSITDIDPTHIHPGNKKDNFWEMGDTGPCGPCSEIHIDLTPDLSGGHLVNAGDPRVMEVWNLVFIQFNRGADGKLAPLPARHVDTGMGFERITAVLQGMESGRLGQVSNYDTDVFTPIFAGIRAVTGAPVYTGLLEPNGEEPLPHGRGSVQSLDTPQSRDRKGAVPPPPNTLAGPPVAYFITFLTYGTWLHGREAGSVDDEHNAFDTPLLEKDEQREREEFVRLKHEPILLDERRRALVDRTIREVCHHRGWELYEVNVRTNHVHVVVSADVPPEKIMNDLKSYSTRRMVEAGIFPAQTKAWTRHGSTRYLWKPESLDQACRYVREEQGADLAPRSGSAFRGQEEPLPHGRGSDPPLPHGRGSERPTRETVMKDVAYRVIADHIRTLTFALTDGAVPSNEGRGYVLRRILRRAVRYARQYLNVHEPFLCKLVPVVVDAMGHAFPELKANPQRVADLIREEEESFIKTLDRGIELFEEAAERAKYAGRSAISGEDAFKLHDTYGFPFDLTEVMARERGMTVEKAEYDRLMEEAKDRARSAGKSHASLAGLVGGDLPETNDAERYESLRTQSQIACWIDGGQLHTSGAVRPSDSELALITTNTCFYAEGGGQVGDVGTITTPTGVFAVRDTLKQGKTVIHFGSVVSGKISVGQTAALQVDARRNPTMKNHSATHVLNWALREVLEIGGGGKVDQKGSLVDPDKTRFDFSHNKPLTPEEVARIETLCTQQIQANLPVYTKEVSQAEARKINTLRAVFGEKYSDMVRVVSIGADIEKMLADPQNPEWMKYSVEFCGGTHVQSTNEIGSFVLTAEESVAKGVRRVVGVSGEKALQAIEAGKRLRERAAKIKAGPADQVTAGIGELQKQLAESEIPLRDRIALRAAIAELQEIIKEQSKQQARAAGGAIKEMRQQLLDGAERVNGHAIVVGELPEAPVEQVREAADWLRTQAGSAVVCLGLQIDGKPLLLAAITDDLVAKGLKAGDLIKAIVPAIDGRGGGKPNLAQAGGNKPEGVPDALAAARDWIKQKLAE